MMILSIKNTILAALLGFAVLGGLFFATTTHAGYEDLPAFVKNEVGQLRDHIEARKDAYASYRDAYLATKSEWQNKRTAVGAAMQNIRNCNGDPSPTCDLVRLARIDAQRTFITGTIDRMEAHLGSVETYLVAHINDETEEGVATDWIAAIRADLVATQAQADALTNQSTQADVVVILQDMKAEFKEVRTVSSAIRTHYLLSTAKKAQEKFQALHDRFVAELGEFEGTDTDTEKLEQSIADYAALVSDIQSHIDEATILYQNLVTSDGVNEEMLEAAASNFGDRAVATKTHFKNVLGAAKDVFEELHTLNQQ